MDEYIEREALREVIVNLQFSKHLNKAASLNLMHRAVDNLPAADIVPVVRCWERKHRKYDDIFGMLWCNLDSCTKRVKPDDFCSYGERKEGTE